MIDRTPLDHHQQLTLSNHFLAVEVDIHLINDTIVVGHSTQDVESSRTLKEAYLDPLYQLLADRNKGLEEGAWKGVYDGDGRDGQTLYFFIDLVSSTRRCRQLLLLID